MESGGTVLSTNWKDVGKRKVEMSPPDDVEFKKYWAPPAPYFSAPLGIILLNICPREVERRSSALYTAVHFLLFSWAAADVLVFTLLAKYHCSHFHEPLIPLFTPRWLIWVICWTDWVLTFKRTQKNEMILFVSNSFWFSNVTQPFCLEAFNNFK